MSRRNRSPKPKRVKYVRAAVAKLDVKRGDALIVSLDQDVTTDLVDLIGRRVSLAAPGCRVLVVPKGMRVSVASLSDRSAEPIVTQ
jgi:hypothetical protein